MEIVYCPDCGVACERRSDFVHTCPAKARTAYCYYRLKDDHIVDSFVMVGGVADDPLLAVETLAPDGLTQRWAMRQESGRLVFYPPDGYAGGQGLLIRTSKEIQRAVIAPRDVLEREALGHRVTLGA